MSKLGFRMLVLALAMVAAAAAVAIGPGTASGVTIGDITRVEGQRINKLIGHGLVIGLKGTGDGGDFLPAIRPLAALLQQFSNPVLGPSELEDVKNVALVIVTATVPGSGARLGDRLDVQVSAIGACKSLKGGRLVLMPLQGPQKNAIVYALAEGPVRLEDPQVPTSGVVDGGAVIEEEVPTEFVENNRFRLILKEASGSFSMAANLADVINQHTEYEVGYPIAKALDARTVEVQVPEAYRENPVPFLGRMQRLDLILPRGKARVEINERTGTIVITGNVEISPVVVSHKTLVVTAQPAATATATSPTTTSTATAMAPFVEEGPFFGLDPQGEGGARLQDLVSAMNVLKVPAEDRIAIVKLLSKAGQIHADVLFAE